MWGRGVMQNGEVPIPTAGSGSSDNVVTVWTATLAQARRGWLKYLDSAERHRFGNLRQPADRARLLLGGCLVRAVAARRLAMPPDQIVLDRRCPECGEPHGGPRAIGTDLAFSVSHSGDWVLVAACPRGAVGVDIEWIDPEVDVLSLAPRTLNSAERDALAMLTPDRRPAGFVRYWTRKEAVLKVTGDGFRTSPSDVHISGPDEAARLHTWPAHPELVDGLWLEDLDVATGYAACVAFASALPRPVQMRAAGPILAVLG